MAKHRSTKHNTRTKEERQKIQDLIDKEPKFCSCPDGADLRARVNWAKPRCNKCLLFVNDLDLQRAKTRWS